MRASIYTKYGPPEVVSVQEVTEPKVADNDVLIRVHATTVNRTDCGFRSAEYFISRFFSGLIRPKNQILGNEFAGEVVALGIKVTQFQVGDRVFGYNDQTFGAHAQFMVMNENDNIVTMPSALSFEEAAPICEGAHYAWCDIRAAKVSSTHNCLVNGATGAIGSAAVQLLLHLGCTVTAVCHTKNVEQIKSLGAHEVIDYTQQDFTAVHERYHFIFDAVGKSSFMRCKAALKEKGIYISTELGSYGANIFLALLTPLLGGKKVLFPLPTLNKDDVNFLKSLVESGSFRPLIDRTFDLEDIIDAHRYVETGQKIGNVVIRVRS